MSSFVVRYMCVPLLAVAMVAFYVLALSARDSGDGLWWYVLSAAMAISIGPAMKTAFDMRDNEVKRAMVERARREATRLQNALM